jgi:hypothetical protein
MFRKIKSILKTNRSGVTQIEAQDKNGTWQLITDKNEIETQCIKENIKRMMQAIRSPTMISDDRKNHHNTK